MNRNLNGYMGLLQGNPLFADMDGTSILAVLELMRAHVTLYEAGDTIVSQGDVFPWAAIVLAGRVAASYLNEDGLEICLSQFSEGDTIGLEFSWNGPIRIPLFVSARKPTLLLTFDLSEFRRRTLANSLEIRFLRNIVDTFAAQKTEMNQRVLICNQKHIRSRLRTYILSLPREDDAVVFPMKRMDLADYLGVDHSALSRELSRMKRDGLISVERRHIRLLDAKYFAGADQVSRQPQVAPQSDVPE